LMLENFDLEAYAACPRSLISVGIRPEPGGTDPRS
jgi:hypothetical protein